MGWLEDEYTKSLGRNGSKDAAGLSYWQNQVDSGAITQEQAKASIYNSDEAKKYRYNQGAARAAEQKGSSPVTTLSGTDNETQIRNLYRTQGGRTADDEGLAYWKNVAETKGMDHVNAAFGNTQEIKGYNSVQKPVASKPEVAPYSPSYSPTTRAIDPATETVEGRLESLLDPNNPLMKQAKTRGLEYANGRGLLNSSIAGDSVQGEMMKSAFPIASQDSAAYQKQGLANQGYENQFGLENLRNEFTSYENSLQRDATWRNQLAGSASDREIESLKQQSGLFAQFTKGVADINSSDMEQSEKDLAVQSLWDQFERGSDIASSIRTIVINDDGTVTRTTPTPTAPVTDTDSTGSTGAAQIFGGGGEYLSGFTKNADGDLVDSDGKVAPTDVKVATYTTEGRRYDLIDGRWKVGVIPKADRPYQIREGGGE